MKLPTEKKDRMLVLSSWALGVLALLAAIYELAVIPFMSSWDAQTRKYGKTASSLSKAQVELAKMPLQIAAYSNVIEQIQGISEHDVLQPVLGTYLLGVREMVEDMAQGCGIKIEAVREVGIFDAPGKKDKRDSAFRRYGAQVSGASSYESLGALIGKLEEGNAFLCVSSLHITSQPDKPELHRFSFTVEWPIWRNPEAAPAARTQRE